VRRRARSDARKPARSRSSTGSGAAGLACHHGMLLVAVPPLRLFEPEPSSERNAPMSGSSLPCPPLLGPWPAELPDAPKPWPAELPDAPKPRSDATCPSSDAMLSISASERMRPPGTGAVRAATAATASSSTLRDDKASCSIGRPRSVPLRSVPPTNGLAPSSVIPGVPAPGVWNEAWAAATRAAAPRTWARRRSIAKAQTPMTNATARDPSATPATAARLRDNAGLKNTVSFETEEIEQPRAHDELPPPGASGTRVPVGSTVVTTEVWPFGSVVVYTSVVEYMLHDIPDELGCGPENVDIRPGRLTDGVNMGFVPDTTVGIPKPGGKHTEKEHGVAEKSDEGTKEEVDDGGSAEKVVKEELEGGGGRDGEAAREVEDAGGGEREDEEVEEDEMGAAVEVPGTLDVDVFMDDVGVMLDVGKEELEELGRGGAIEVLVFDVLVADVIVLDVLDTDALVLIDDVLVLVVDVLVLVTDVLVLVGDVIVDVIVSEVLVLVFEVPVSEVVVLVSEVVI
jgi:hypothetical protein